MARKKLSKESRKQPQDRDLSPVEKARSLTETKSLETLNQNLKTLNQMLAKETMENRFQIESLKSELEERSGEEPLLFDIERGIYRLVVSSSLSEKEAAAETARKLEARVRVLEEETAAVALEREEMERKAKKRVEAFDSLKAVMLEELERSIEKSSALDKELRDAVEMSRVSRAEVCMLKKEPEMLRSEIVELERKNGELKGEVDGLQEKERRLEMHMSESALKLEELGEKIEKVELEKEELASEIVLLEKRNGELEGDVGRLLASVNYLEKEKEEEKMNFDVKFREYAAELDALRELMGVMEREKAAVEQAKVIQEVEILELKEEAMKLNSRLSVLHELEKRNGELEGEVDRLLANISDLEKEKMGLEVKLREYALELDDLIRRMGVTEQEKGAVEQAKTIQDVEIRELKIEVMKLSSRLSVLHELEERKGELEGEVDRLLANIRGLEKEKEEKETILSAKLREFDDLREKLGAIVVEKDAIMQAKENQEVEILELKKDIVKLNSSLSVLHELEKRNREFEGEVNGLQKEKEEKETIIAAKISELDDLRERMGAVLQAKAKSEAEILELKEEVMKLNSSLLELQDSSIEYIETNAQLRADQDAARRELKDLRVSLDALASEKEVVSEQKALLEKSLFAAETKCRDMEGKVRAAEVTSSKALSLLKGTVEAVNGSVEARESGVREIGAVNDDENIRPFLGELESIRTAHHNRVARMEEMNRELEEMKSAMVDARKKRGLWMWLYPLTSTFVAAISIAYAAKVR